MVRTKLKVGTKVKFNIAQGLDIGIAIIKQAERDVDDSNSFHYKLEVIEGSKAIVHRDFNGDLWVNDFEVEKIEK